MQYRDAVPDPIPYNCPALLSLHLPLSKRFKGVSFLQVSLARGWMRGGHLPAPQQGCSMVFAQHLWLQGVTLAGMPSSSPVIQPGPRGNMCLARGFFCIWTGAEAVWEGEALQREMRTQSAPKEWYTPRDAGGKEL